MWRFLLWVRPLLNHQGRAGNDTAVLEPASVRPPVGLSCGLRRQLGAPASQQEHPAGSRRDGCDFLHLPALAELPAQFAGSDYAF